MFVLLPESSDGVKNRLSRFNLVSYWKINVVLLEKDNSVRVQTLIESKTFGLVGGDKCYVDIDRSCYYGEEELIANESL